MVTERVGEMSTTEAVIAQTVHAELSGMFAARWGNATFARPQPYQPVVRAAIYHDAGWYRYEARPTYDVATRSTPGFAQVPADQTQLAAYQWAIDWRDYAARARQLLALRQRVGPCLGFIIVTTVPGTFQVRLHQPID
jgi:hypothetical protein